MFFVGCGGGGSSITLIVGNISGPTLVAENTTANYTVTASGDTGITYLWAIAPSTAGTITGGTTSNITFVPTLVTSDTAATIQVTVNSDSAGPEVATLNISVTDVAVADNGWALTWGGTNTDSSRAVLIASSGDIYVAGSYMGTIDVDPGSGTSNLTSNGDSDIYLSRFDSDGVFGWSLSFGGTNNEYCSAMAEDSSGNLYLTGGYMDTVDFDPGSGVTSRTSAGDVDAFMAMFDPDGNFMWVETWGGTANDGASALIIDSTNHIWVGGGFSDTVDFDPGAATDDRTSNGVQDAYISLFNSTGTWNDVLVWGGTGHDGCTVLELDSAGNVYAGGFFRDTVDFDPGSGTTSFASAGDSDAYLNVFDSSGGFLWTLTWGGTSFDTSYDIAINGSGMIYVTGIFSATVDFDPGATTDSHTSAGSYDAYLSVLDTSGNFQSAYSWGGTGQDSGDYITLDSTGNIYVAGKFADSVDFDPGAGSKTIVSEGDRDIFLSKFDSSFNLLWAQSWGGINLEWLYGIDIDANGSAYLVGYFSDTVDFDPGINTDDRLTTGGNDSFLLKVLPNGFWE